MDNEEGKEPKVEEPKANEVQGESADNDPSGAVEPAVDYSMVMEKLSAIETNQSALVQKVQALTDAQSVLVDAGAVVREVPAENVVPTNGNEDAFIPLEELDFSI